MMWISFGTPNSILTTQHPHIIIRIVVDQNRLPHSINALNRINDSETTINSAFFSVPLCCCRLRRMEPYLATDPFIAGERGESAAIFQLITTRLHVFADKVIVDHQAIELHGISTIRTDKTIKHGQAGKHVNCLGTPSASDLKTSHAIRKRKP